MGSALSVLDVVHLGSTFALRAMFRLGSALSVTGVTRFSSSLSVRAAHAHTRNTCFARSASGSQSALLFLHLDSSGSQSASLLWTWVGNAANSCRKER